jgi:hypothetical protein
MQNRRTVRPYGKKEGIVEIEGILIHHGEGKLHLDRIAQFGELVRDGLSGYPPERLLGRAAKQLDGVKFVKKSKRTWAFRPRGEMSAFWAARRNGELYGGSRSASCQAS